MQLRIDVDEVDYACDDDKAALQFSISTAKKKSICKADLLILLYFLCKLCFADLSNKQTML